VERDRRPAPAGERGLEIGVRCGGHSGLGLYVPDDGLMIDLRPRGEVRVGLQRRRARVEGGAMLGALDRAAMEHRLTTTAGNTNFIVNGRFKPHAVRDRHLITGQRQHSGDAAARLIVEALGV
jgi:FAD binding domain